MIFRPLPRRPRVPEAFRTTAFKPRDGFLSPAIFFGQTLQAREAELTHRIQRLTAELERIPDQLTKDPHERNR